VYAEFVQDFHSEKCFI